jgi:hypothetical protein
MVVIGQLHVPVIKASIPIVWALGPSGDLAVTLHYNRDILLSTHEKNVDLDNVD